MGFRTHKKIAAKRKLCREENAVFGKAMIRYGSQETVFNASRKGLSSPIWGRWGKILRWQKNRGEA